MRRLPLTVLLLVLLLVLAGPLVLSGDPMLTEASNQLQAPNATHPLGTDLLGRDVLLRVLYGGRLTLTWAAGATLLGFIPGVLFGLLTVESGRFVSRMILLLLNAWLAIPGLIIALVIITLVGRGGGALILAVGLAQIPACAYITRAAALEVRSQAYVEAAAALGARRYGLLMEHILPGISPTIMSYLGVMFSFSLLNGSGLSFLGLGAEPGLPEWGTMLAEGRAAFRTAPWISFAPGLAISLTAWAVNRIASGFTLRRWP